MVAARLNPSAGLPPKRLHVRVWLWGAIELAALWRARWRQRVSGH